MMRVKKLGLILFVLILSISLVACSSNGGNNSSGETSQKEGSPQKEESSKKSESGDKTERVLKLAHYIDPANKDDVYGVAMTEIIQQFEAETGIKVDLETLPWDQMESKLVISNAAGETVDLSWVSSQKLASLVNAGALRPIDDFVATYDKKIMDDFSELEDKATVSELDGKKYLYLASMHTRMLWYNKELVNTPPQTWAELVEIGKQATDKSKGQYGFGFWGSKHYGSIEVAISPFIWSAGGTISNKDGEVTFNSPETVEALQFVGDLVHKHGISPESVFTSDSAEIDNAFKAGNIAMVINGSYMYDRFMETEFAKAGNIGVAPIPGKNGPAPNFINGWGMAIPKNAKNPELAWEFMKFFNQTEIQIKHSLAEGGIPTRKSAWTDKAFEDKPLHQFFFKNAEENGRPMDPLVYYQEGLEALNIAALGYFLDAKANVKQLLDDQAKMFNDKY